MKKNENKVSLGTILKEGILTSNPLFVSLLGFCPALAITTSVMNAIGMTIAFTFVLVLSNITISLIRKIVPNAIRIPVFIIIIATFVSCISLLMEAYMNTLFDSLGAFVTLIVVNCIILGRAEAFASKNKVIPSIIDALGQSLGYGLALFVIAIIREVLGNQSIKLSNPFDSSQSITFDLINGFNIPFFTTPAGAFVTMGVLVAIITAIKNSKDEKTKKMKGDAK